jgi:hypothetical protein
MSDIEQLKQQLEQALKGISELKEENKKVKAENEVMKFKSL